jgi:hypothetical protein
MSFESIQKIIIAYIYIFIKRQWDQPDLNRRPPAPEAGIIPS